MTLRVGFFKISSLDFQKTRIVIFARGAFDHLPMAYLAVTRGAVNPYEWARRYGRAGVLLPSAAEPLHRQGPEK